ncbi:MAG: GNAT family N-acetyltransferase [Theionarchaea archaeon]|nr:MAG: hypothetical protein AYK18_11095 [Theionarchaea archaeon DG-70]MBU7011318.1 GNAT family N-acetyltransferase [Theionarchaea archaeon]
MDIHYRIIDRKKELEKSRELRYSVFVKEQCVPEDLERDNFDDMSIHVIPAHNETTVGTGRITICNGKAKNSSKLQFSISFILHLTESSVIQKKDVPS